jgi:uncharacterized protein YggU (UPF0235/DUF167 family)
MIEAFLDELSPLPTYVRIKAVPKQPKTELFARMDDGTWKIRVAAVPEKGKANLEIIRYLSEITGFAKSRFEIVSGAGDVFKLVKIRPE